MLLVILSWFYIFFTSVTLGILLNYTAKLKCNNNITISFIGFFLATILASIWAVFARVNIEFHILFLFLNFVLTIKYKYELIAFFKSLTTQIKELSKSLKIFLFLTTVLITAKCTSFSNYIDNESYYIQTIKWINEYGFVKGLVNLHAYLGQTSGWHITQSVFNFSFFNLQYNDINGLILILIHIFALTKLTAFFKNKNQLFLIIGLLPIATVILFQFINVPSPDLATYLFSFLLFYYFIKHFDNIQTENFNLIFILSIFIVYIKITSIPLLLLPLILLILNFKKLYSKIHISYIFGAIVFSLFILKNLIITGYPFFSSRFLKDVIPLNYSLPNELYDFYFNKARLYSFTILKSEFKTMNALQIFIKWLFNSKIDSVFNVLILLTGILTPYFLKRYFNKTAYWILYFVFIIKLLFLFSTSPQYRFILNFVLFFGFLITSCLIKEKRMIINFFYFSITLVILTFIYTIKPYNAKLKTKLFKVESNVILTENLFFPYQNSNLNTIYKSYKTGNLIYNSPDINTVLWITGNGKLPCVNRKQLEFFKKRYGYIPQMQTNNLKDGFYSKNITKNE